MITYQATCNQCGMMYIGNTQRQFKDRMNQHFADVVNLVNRDQASDSFAAHFAGHIDPSFKSEATNGLARAMVNLKIPWQGDPISCSKSFQTPECSLCMKERTLILKQFRKDPISLINLRYEIYGACRHKTKFHRFRLNTSPSTDEGQNSPERIQGGPNFYNQPIGTPYPPWGICQPVTTVTEEIEV